MRVERSTARPFCVSARGPAEMRRVRRASSGEAERLVAACGATHRAVRGLVEACGATQPEREGLGEACGAAHLV